MMTRLYNEVIELAKTEYERASKNWGPTNHSAHESYAVLKEEMDEARMECIQTELWTDKYWTEVKNNNGVKQEEYIKEVYLHSLLAACEFIQTAAMAQKALATMRVHDTKAQGEH